VFRRTQAAAAQRTSSRPVGVNTRGLLLSPGQEFVERWTERLSPIREEIFDFWRDLRMHDALDDAVLLELPKLLRQHLLRHAGNGALQIGKAERLAAKQMKEEWALRSSMWSELCHMQLAHPAGRLKPASSLTRGMPPSAYARDTRARSARVSPTNGPCVTIGTFCRSPA
jgi:hypothetical protein